ncbi:MAG: malonyl-ACP O-methyltransferase BioC [Candidatus Omnitrophota bacterium]
MDKNKVKENFSRYAGSYDKYASIQKIAAKKLAEEFNGSNFRTILEIGCGTGLYTGLLREKFGNAEITAVDISPDMVGTARKKMKSADISFIVCDAEKLTPGRKFDLVTSNASLQWVQNPPRLFKKIASMLTTRGEFHFSMYGPDTFNELKEVLGVHYGRRKWLSSAMFADLEETKSSLNKVFTKVNAEETYIKEDFFSLMDFLKSIKHTGTRGEGLGSAFFLGKYAINEMEKTYIRRFGKITATHHIYFCRCVSETGGKRA